MPEKIPAWVLPVLSLGLNAIILAYVLYHSQASDWLNVLVAWTVLTLVSFCGFMVLGKMVNNDIDLTSLLNEAGGGASFSRFQFLIFTFVISLSLFLVIVHDYKFPPIPTEVLTLLGISASTYAVSKGIQAGSPQLSKGGAAQTAAQQAVAAKAAAETAQQHANTAKGAADTATQHAGTAKDAADTATASANAAKAAADKAQG